jgi:type IV secretory pathway TraG/TraD family ATPase VirD4
VSDNTERAKAPWTLLLDEFGAVIKMAAARAVAILQRGRSHGGQVVVITQSAADIEALTGQPGLLASLTDNFAGVIAHRQTSPESRDWLAKLMGTRALWQSTQATAGHGSQHSGHGSARRVREFRIGADVFSALGRGEAVIYTPLAGEPATAHTSRSSSPTNSPRGSTRLVPGPRAKCPSTQKTASPTPLPPSNQTQQQTRRVSAEIRT